jgi:hypothetical protein
MIVNNGKTKIYADSRQLGFNVCDRFATIFAAPLQTGFLSSARVVKWTLCLKQGISFGGPVFLSPIADSGCETQPPDRLSLFQQIGFNNLCCGKTMGLKIEPGHFFQSFEGHRPYQFRRNDGNPVAGSL